MKKNGAPIVRLLICAGGTGGGVYPALAVYQALDSKRSGVETLWVGSKGGMEEELVRRASVSFTSIPAAGLHGVGLRALPRNLAQLGRGVFASQKVLRDFHPDVLFFTGGFLAGPMALAGRKVPTLLYVPDIEPGLALKSLARYADRIAVSAEESRKYFARQVIVTGYPVRAELGLWTRENGRAALKLDNEVPVLLVVGGSKGARSINHGVVQHLPALLKMAQIVHVTGHLDWQTIEAAKATLTTIEMKRYHAFANLH